MSWLQETAHGQLLVDAVTRFISPEMARLSEEVSVRRSEQMPMEDWKTFFSGIAVISNRVTPNHRDSGGLPRGYDILLSLGDHEAELSLDDLNLRLQYHPRSVVALCGKLLRHKVPHWSGEDRVCYVFFQKDKVIDRFEVQQPQWVKHTSYLDMMDKDFVTRCL